MDPADLIAAAALLARCEAAPATTYIERDKHQHRHMDDGATRPPIFTPPTPPLSNTSMLDAANRAALMWAEQKYHPAYYQSAARSAFRR